MSKRTDFVNKALSWVGTKEKSAGHKTIVADYNKACDKGRKATTATLWCAVFVGAVAQETNNVLKDGVGVPVDYSCGTGAHSLIAKAKAAGIWVESDAYAPRVGDVIIYDWSDDGKGDDTTGHDHTGIVTSLSGNSFVVTEGNRKNSVSNRTMTRNGRYIRGFIAVKFADEVTPEPAPTPEPTPALQTYKVKTNTGTILRLRAEPNTKSAVVARMPNGTIVKVDTITNGWAHIPDYKGKSGFASMTYLVKV